MIMDDKCLLPDLLFFSGESNYYMWFSTFDNTTKEGGNDSNKMNEGMVAELHKLLESKYIIVGQHKKTYYVLNYLMKSSD